MVKKTATGMRTELTLTCEISTEVVSAVVFRERHGAEIQSCILGQADKIRRSTKEQNCRNLLHTSQDDSCDTQNEGCALQPPRMTSSLNNQLL